VNILKGEMLFTEEEKKVYNKFYNWEKKKNKKNDVIKKRQTQNILYKLLHE